MWAVRQCPSWEGQEGNPSGSPSLNEALHWLEKSLGLVEAGSAEHFALLYELASLHEDNGDRRKALELYTRVKEWNPAYRDVSKKVDKLS